MFFKKIKKEIIDNSVYLEELERLEKLMNK